MTTSQTALLLERLGALFQLAVREDAARYGLLPIHIQVLHYLARANCYSDLPIAIAEYFGITRGTVSQTLSVLERKGFLVRMGDPHHGKRVHLRLTAAGEAVLQDSWVERVEQAMEGMSAGGTALQGMLRDLLSALQRMNGQRAFGVCRQCVHFLGESKDARCGLTGDSLVIGQTVRICREWTAPAASRSDNESGARQ